MTYTFGFDKPAFDKYATIQEDTFDMYEDIQEDEEMEDEDPFVLEEDEMELAEAWELI